MAEIGFDPDFKQILKDAKIKDILKDQSLWTLIASNLIIALWAVIEGWALGLILWVYLAQSIIIGILWFFKILCLREFSTEGFEINNQPVSPTSMTKIRTSFFFLLHYGFFHIIYCFFIFATLEDIRIISLCLPITFIILSQIFSFFFNKKWYSHGKPNIGSMMFFPYVRIIPMHLTIIFGLGFLNVFSTGKITQRIVLFGFMILKTLADALMHIIEKIGFSDKPKKQKLNSFTADN